MITSETIKRVLLSVLDSGERSPQFNVFYQICLDFSVATLRLRRNQFIIGDIIKKLGYSIQDLASDCIDDLFETRDGKFIHINSYFNKKYPTAIDTVHEDNLKVNLAVLIKSKTNQQLSELRTDLGEIYFRIKKSLQTDISRKSNTYKRFTFKGVRFLQLNHSAEINMELPPIEKMYIIPRLLKTHFKNHNVSQVIIGFFEILNTQNEYCKAIEEKHLLEILKEYYSLKMDGKQW